MNPAHLPILEQLVYFQTVVSTNETLVKVLSLAATLDLPNWYLAGGSISQTIWNHVSHLPPEHGITDYDLVYHDPSDLSWEAEDSAIQRGRTIFADIPIDVEIRNQARVHLWYGPKYGIPCAEHKCTESAIEQWLTTSAMVGINLRDGEWNVFAPRGFADFFNLVVRPHRELGTREAYRKKVERWRALWKDLRVIPWEGGSGRIDGGLG